MSTRLPPTKKSDSQPLQRICSWTHLPCWSVAALVHAFSKPTMMTVSCSAPSHCICGDSSNAFNLCPHFTCPRIMEFQVTTSHTAMLLNALCASTMVPHLAYMSIRLLPTNTAIHNLFVWSVYGCVCLLHVLVNWHICWAIEKKWTCWESCPCYCICQKVSIIFLRCPALAYHVSLAFSKMFIGTVSGAIAASFASTHGGVDLLLNQNVSCVCLKSGYLAS